MKHVEFGQWLKNELGCKVQKLPVDIGCTCPNRDGRIGVGGCTFCNNKAFTPRYCNAKDSVTEQLEQGKAFFRRHSNCSKYLAYFQSFTSTYGEEEHLISCYEEALSVADVVGIVIGTRPDCMSDTMLDYFTQLNERTFLLIEYGVESCNDETLRRVNRGHDFAVAKQMICRTAERGIRVGAHFMLGFPWETHEDAMRQAEIVATLPLTTLKLHQLQVLRGTALAEEYERSPWTLPTAEEYAETLHHYLQRLPDHLVLDRFVSQCPPGEVIAPHWGLKANEFNALMSRYN